MRATLIAAVLVSAAVVPAVRAGDLYVARPGTDAGNDCRDPGRPCHTIARAAEQAASGETVKVARGAYRESILVKDDAVIGFSGLDQ